MSKQPVELLRRKKEPASEMVNSQLQKKMTKVRSHLHDLESDYRKSPSPSSLPEVHWPTRGEGNRQKEEGDERDRSNRSTQVFLKQQVFQELVSDEVADTEEYLEKVDEFVEIANELAEVDQYLQNVKVVRRACGKMKRDVTIQGDMSEAAANSQTSGHQQEISRDSQNQQVVQNICTERYAELKTRRKELKANRRAIMIEIRRLERTIYP